MASAEANSRLVQIVLPAYDQIIKNVSRRKHPKLAGDCKSAIDHINAATNQSRTPTAAAASPAGESDPEEPPIPGVLLDLSLSDSEVILNPIIDALTLNNVKASSFALDAVHKLIGIGFLHGEPDHNGSPDAKLLAKLIDGVCKSHDCGDENLELMLIRTLLSGVSSIPLRIHGDCLLHIVKTCYDVYMVSKNVVSQTIAKGAMAQISAIVFRRMEADSIAAPLQPVVAAELLKAPEKGNDDGSVTLFSLGFITKTMQDMDVVNSPSTWSNGGSDLGGQDESETKGYRPDSNGSMYKDFLDTKHWEINIYKKALEVNKGMVDNGEGEKINEMEVQIGNMLRRDAYLVLRALCKLSMQAPPKDTAADSHTMKGKIVALELLRVLLDNSGITFRTNERFLDAIRQYLCLSLLKNIASPLLVIFQLSCSIFISLVTRFRAGLKAEVGVFFPMIVLKVLENVAQPNFQQKLAVIQSLEKLSADSQIWIDIFLNYDCDVNATNIFERVINGLLRTAQGVSPGVSTTLQPSQDVTMKQVAMKCLIAVLKSMSGWMDKQLRIPVCSSPKNAEAADNNDDHEAVSSLAHEHGDEHTETSDYSTESSDVSNIEQRRAYKLELQEGITLFNRKPSRGIEFLINANKVGSSPEEIAAFLKNASGLNKTMIGNYLGEWDDFPLKVMHAFVDSFDFKGMEFDEAIRTFLQGFRLPGEAQKIDRIMEKFAQRYCKCNPDAFTSADTAYVLAYSVIMLNTDAHNPMVKNKMSADDFIQNNRGVDDGKDLPEEYMRSLFERITKKEIKMKEDDLSFQQRQSVNSNRMLGLDAILNIVIRKQSEDTLETGDDLLKHMQEQFKEKACKSESTYYPAMDVVILKFMIEACWAPMLAAFSVPLDRSDDETIISLCLDGFRVAIHITAAMSMTMHRDAFVTSLAKFTSLHSPADIKQKNIDAIKVIITIADEDGNYLQEAWEHILTCASRFEHLRVLGEGGNPYTTLLAISQNEFDKSKPYRSNRGSAASATRRRSSYDSIGIGGSTFPELTSNQLNYLFTKLNLAEKVGEMNHIFLQSQNLNSEAIVDFFKALCKVSIDELHSTPNPRVFSITKIVEITNYNMNRIRLVWSMVWQVLSDFFVTLGCSENLSIAIYAMDTLRQVSMKFLDREELANYNFQTEFMKPFVIVMRKSSAVEIRELIIRCVSQMVLSRVDHVKSGWKSMFMVFTTAANDDHKNNVLLSFEIIEKIVRDYFTYITETETNTFTDCVNCLIAFTSSRSNKEINLSSIGFLRFCAAKLAEGDLGKQTVESNKNPESKESTENAGNLHIWYPLLAGLSELSFDPRTEIRKSAMQVLFESLRQYGHHFSIPLWEKVFDSVLLRIFDHALHSTDSYTTTKPTARIENGDGEEQHDRDAGIYETCTSALQLAVDLFINFYDIVNPLLKKLLAIFVSFIQSPNQNFAGVGIDALVRLTGSCGEMFSENQWFEVLSSLKRAANNTLPDFSFVLTEKNKLSARDENPIAESPRSVEEMDSLRREYLSSAVSFAKCRAAIQMLLIQAIMDIHDTHGDRISIKNTIIIFDTVHAVAFHAYKINSDMTLRPRLQELEPITQMQDPPLLRLENLAYQICLTLLENILSNQSPNPESSPQVESYLVSLCQEVLQSYVDAASLEQMPDHLEKQPLWMIPIGSGRRKELAARAPLIVATLQAICTFRDSLLEKNLRSLFPLISGLISCEHGSEDVQQALSEMLVSAIGPVLLRSC